VLITCLRAVEINKKALISNLKKKSINNELNIENYLNEITQQLKKRMSRFIHIRGEENFSVLGSYVIEYQDDTSDSRRRKGTVEYLRDNSIPERRMMIWGEAGMGKTTTLEYLTYMDAKKRLKDSNYNIPVLVLLGVMTKATYTIKQYICDKLDIGVDICESLLEEGKINLFLDGLNEIPADAGGNLKTLRMREIKQLLRDYPKTFIIITNRPLSCYFVIQ
jgi:predicted NACHT family NTPase